MIRLKEIAKSRGVKLVTIAKALGITYRALNAQTLAGSNPTLKRLQDVAALLDCTVGELIGEVPIKEYTPTEARTPAPAIHTLFCPSCGRPFNIVVQRASHQFRQSNGTHDDQDGEIPT